jgi:hypothetical protein
MSVTQLTADFQSSFATVDFLKNVVEKCDASAVSNIIGVLAESRAGMNLDTLGQILDLIDGDPELIECLDKLLKGTLGIMQYGGEVQGVLLREAGNVNMQEVWKSGTSRVAISTKKRKLAEKAGAPAKKRGRPPKKPAAVPLPIVDALDGKGPATKDGSAASTWLSTPLDDIATPPTKRGRPPKKPPAAASMPIVEDLDEKVATALNGPGPATDAAPVDDIVTPKKRGRPPKKPVTATATVKGATPKKLGRPPKKPAAASMPIDEALDRTMPAKKDGPGPATNAAPLDGVSPKKRGRPPKKATATADATDKGASPNKLERPPEVASSDSAIADKETPPKKKRGRPRKNPEGGSPKKRGRPRKNPIVATSPEAFLPISLPPIPSQRMHASSVNQFGGNSKPWIPIAFLPYGV